MLAVITGGSGSGKSKYAESFLQELCPEEKVYLATMQFIDEEMKGRIQKHREMRAGKHFTTIERGMAMEEVKLPEGNRKGLLLECLSNLVANEMYDTHARMKDGTEEEIAEYILRGICHVRAQTEHMVIVTNEVFSEYPAYEETKRYLKIFGNVNQQLAREADRVIEVVYGIPVRVK